MKNKFLFLFLFFLCLLPIWFFDYVPILDYPQHLLRIHIMKNLDNAAFDYSQNYSLNITPTNFILDYFVIAISNFVSIDFAIRFILSVYLLLLPLSIFYFLFSLDKNQAILGFLSFPLAYNFFVNMGFVSFVLSLPFFFFSLGYFIRNFDLKPEKSMFPIAIISSFLLFLHVFYFLFLCFCIFLILFFEKGYREAINKILWFFPHFLILFIVVLLNYSSISNSLYFVFDPIILVYLLSVFPFEYSAFSLFIFFIILSFWLFLLFRSLFLKDFPSYVKRSFFTPLLIGTLLIFLILPMHLGIWGYFKIRILPFFYVVFLSLVKVPRGEKIRKVILFLSVFLTFLSVFSVFLDFHERNAEVSEYVSGISLLDRNSDFLPLNFGYGNCLTRYALCHSWAYYAIGNGGKTPYFNLFKEYHPLKKNYADPGHLGVLFNYPEEYSKGDYSSFEYVIVWNRSAEVERTISKNFVLIYSSDRLRIYSRER